MNRSELRQLLDVAAGSGEAPHGDDIAALPTRRGADPDEVVKMREAVAAGGQRIGLLRRDGQHAAARRLAADVAREWRHLIGERRAPGPDLDELDPRGLASLINDRHRL